MTSHKDIHSSRIILKKYGYDISEEQIKEGLEYHTITVKPSPNETRKTLKGPIEEYIPTKKNRQLSVLYNPPIEENELLYYLTRENVHGYRLYCYLIDKKIIK